MSLYNYITYIEYLNKKLSGFFENQKKYICCKKGCAKCCKHGNYPFSEIEFRYLMFGFKKLDINKQNEIKNKIINLNEEKITSSEKYLMYECPFLFNDECVLYDYRGIICRTFGLMYFREDGSTKIPFCAFDGLNYANVLDTETKTISEGKFEEHGYKQEPLAFNVHYNFLTDKDHEFGYGIEFGERNTLLDWLIEEFHIQ